MLSKQALLMAASVTLAALVSSSPVHAGGGVRIGIGVGVALYPYYPYYPY